VLGWVHVDDPVQVFSTVGLAYLRSVSSADGGHGLRCQVTAANLLGDGVERRGGGGGGSRARHARHPDQPARLDRLRFTGRTLRTGTYRLSVTAVDKAGNRSKAATRTFRVLNG